MSLSGLFPFTAAAAAENNNNNKSAAAAASFLGALSDNSVGSYHQNILLTPAVGAEGATAVAAALVEGHQQQRQRSPFHKAISPVQQPYISGTGGAKRKLPTFESERGMQQFGKTTTFAASDDDLDDDFKFDVEPRPKRRYEERMSTKLGDIRLKEDDCGGAATAPAAMSVQQQQQHQLHRRTPQFPVESQQQKHKQREGPLIEDVTDWGVSGDEDLFENGGFMFRRPSSSATPIVEEPDECAGAVDGLMAGRVRHDDEEEADELNLDSGCCSSSSSAEEEERQSIELSPELRNLITSMNNNRDGAAAVPTSILRPIRTGKELIPFMPSPIAAAVVTAASIPSCSLTENGRRFQHEDDEQQQQQLLLRVEEVLDDEILPDAAVGTPQVLSDNEEYWPPTPPPFDGMMSDEDGPDDVIKQRVLVNEEEEAMEMD